MNSFNKLIQTKRTKMLILVLFLTLSLFLRHTTGINLTYIVRKEEDLLHPSCIAEEAERYTAVGWIYPIPESKEKLPNISTKFIPNINNDFNCKFSKQDKCNSIWLIKNWHIDENSSRTFDLILDERWDDFPVIFTNEGREYKESIEIPNIFRAGFSVRASNNIELLVCEGWNPHTYPCYLVNMTETQIFLYKFARIPKLISISDKALNTYKAFTNILSNDEWRNFIVSLDEHGVFNLIDVNFNRTVIEYKDPEPLKPLYLLPHSLNPVLWKIHQNQFIYTKTAQISRLGPILNLVSRDLCVSFFVSTCHNCSMSFIIMKDNKRKILKEIEPTGEFEWTLVKLKEENIASEKLNIFVETKFTEETIDKTEGFWAIDNIRVCHENEAKVTFLKLGNFKDDNIDDKISCQVVGHPKWRPKKLIYNTIKDFPVVSVSSNSTSINLSWPQEDPNRQINYFVKYEANDLCTTEPFNLRRIKSNGFFMTKLDEMSLGNLIPYTKYNITFSTMLHEQEKILFVTTAESEIPSAEELPNKVQIQVTEDVAYVSWDKINCDSIYGHLLYSIKVTNNVLNVTEEVKVQTENTVEIKNLDPFTSYTLNILTSRSYENIQNNVNAIDMNINFTTKPGVAPPVANLELYTIDKNSVSFRYDLPKKPKGIPVYISVARCNPIVFKKCKTSIARITQCELWPKKYCVDINNLIPYQRHTFKLSIRNVDSVFGGETVMDGFTQEQVPGPPTNISYKIVDCKPALDYCHLNISWHHPYYQNGTITSFNIVLNSTISSNTSEDILGVLNIHNKTYMPAYEYQFQYMPYSTQYEVYVQSINTKYKSEFAHAHVKTADVGDHIDQSPKLLKKSDTSVVFKVAPVDFRLKSYKLTVVVQDFDRNKSIPQEILKKSEINDHLCHNFGSTWISQSVEIDNSTDIVTVGNKDQSKMSLSPNTQYCITFIVTNRYKDTEHDVIYYEKMETEDGVISTKTASSSSSQYKHLYGLLLLLLLVPIGFLIYRYIKRRKPKPKQQENQENVYESLPFDECEENCVSNETYDHLLHK